MTALSDRDLLESTQWENVEDLTVDNGETELTRQLEERQRRPWWKRPSPWWQICLFPVSMLAIGCSTPVRLDLMNDVACKEIHPEGILAGGQPCSSDPKVQAAAASLLTVNAMVAGIICCLTAPVWGSLSDRRGRVFIQRFYGLGPLLGGIIIFAVYLLHDQYPFGRAGTIVAAAIEGLFAVGTVTASQAYIADLTEADSRSKWYTLFQGAYFVGEAVGPIISSVIARSTGSVFGVYVLTLAIHLLFLLAAWLVIPESLVPAQMRVAQALHKIEMERHKANGHSMPSKAKAAVWSAIEPLEVFVPTSYSFGATRQKLERRSWDLMLIGIAYFPDTLISGASVFFLEYGIGKFSWTTEDMGVVLSFNSTLKVVFLVFLLPWIIKTIRPASVPLSSRDSSSPPANAESEDSPLLSRSKERRDVHDRGMKWDLGLARTSIIFLLVAITIMALAERALLFIVGVGIVSLASGFTPTMQSFALELYRRRGGTESGGLFGALSVIYALGIQLFGPMIFGIVYAKSTETAPKLIFLLGGSLIICSFLTLLFVRVPPDHSRDIAAASFEDEP